MYRLPYTVRVGVFYLIWRKENEKKNETILYSSIG